jgi:hypothetical protein
MPKAKADSVVIHRIEFQDKEREALEMMAASYSAKNIMEGTSSLIGSFTTASIAGTVLFGSVIAAIGIELESMSPGSQFPGTIGQLGANEELGPFTPKQPGETNREWRRRTSAFDRLKYGLWDKPTREIKELFTEGTPIPNDLW